MFWFVREVEPDGILDGATHKKVEEQVQKWLDLVPAGGRFHAVHGMSSCLESMTAADYVGSDRLDLDHLSA